MAKCVWFLASVGRKRDAGEKEKDSDEIKLVTKLIPIFLLFPYEIDFDNRFKGAHKSIHYLYTEMKLEDMQ